MGIWRSAGVFPVAKRRKEMRAQRLLNARQPANGHRRVLWAAFYVLLSLNSYVSNKNVVIVPAKLTASSACLAVGFV